MLQLVGYIQFKKLCSPKNNNNNIRKFTHYDVLISAQSHSVSAQMWGWAYLALLAEQPERFALVFAQQIQWTFGRAQAAVRWGPVDALAVVLKLQIARTLKTWFVLLYEDHGILESEIFHQRYYMGERKSIIY